MSPFVFDKASILERLGGDEEIFVMMVDMFLQDVDRNCQSLREALGDEAAVLQREAHTIKALLATFSDNAGAELAQTLELRAKTGELADAPARVDVLLARVAEVADVLRRLSVG